MRSDRLPNGLGMQGMSEVVLLGLHMETTVPHDVLFCSTFVWLLALSVFTILQSSCSLSFTSHRLGFYVLFE